MLPSVAARAVCRVMTASLKLCHAVWAENIKHAAASPCQQPCIDCEKLQQVLLQHPWRGHAAAVERGCGKRPALMWSLPLARVRLDKGSPATCDKAILGIACAGRLHQRSDRHLQMSSTQSSAPGTLHGVSGDK